MIGKQGQEFKPLQVVMSLQQPAEETTLLVHPSFLEGHFLGKMFLKQEACRRGEEKDFGR